VLKEGKAFFTNDPANHPQSVGVPSGHPPLTAFLGVPLLKGDKTIGILAVSNREGGYSQNELEALEALSPDIVEAFMRKRGEEALRKSKWVARQRAEELEKLQVQLEEKAAEVEEYANRMEDLAEERAMKLQDAERLAVIGATAGMVGHDIRNPLQAIMGDLYLIASDVASIPEGEEKESIKESIAAIKKNIDHINKIIQDLQDYAKTHKPDVREVNLEEIF
jgi:signal transduction histidine kinase